MRFLDKTARHAIALILVVAIFLTGCYRKISQEEKDLRRNLRAALQQHSYREAERLAHHVLQYTPHDSGAWDRLVQAQCGQGDFKSAKETIAAWRSAVAQPSSKREEYVGDIALAEKDPGLAVQAWHKSLGIEPRNWRVLTKVARIEHAQHHWPESDLAWTAALRIKENPDALVQRAICRRHLHHWVEALADVHRAAAIAPDDLSLRRSAALFNHLSKFLPEIGDLDAQLAISPNDAALLADRSLLFIRAADFELALEDGEAAAKLAPWAMRPKLFAGIGLIRLGRTDEAQGRSVRKSLRIEALTPEFLETIRRLDSEISVERTNAELYAARAWQLNEIGQPGLALQDAESAAQLDPKLASASAEKSYALMKLGQPENAFAEIKRATGLDSNLATAWQYRGELEMAEKDYPAAIESLSRALALNPTAAALQKREACYRFVGWLMKAEEDHHALEQLSAQKFK